MLVILFSGDNCGNCQILKPIFNEVIKELNIEDVKVVNISTPEGRSYAELYGVHSVPTIILNNGNDIKTMIGYKPKEYIKRFIEEF